MNLGEAIDRVSQLAGDEVIFAAKPWTFDSPAIIGLLDAELRVPSEIQSQGMEYFLEGHIVREVLAVLGESETDMVKRRNLILFYATNDAYPEWAYSQQKSQFFNP